MSDVSWSAQLSSTSASSSVAPLVHQIVSSFFQVLKISLLGHRKRIIASLAERPYEEPPVKPPRLSQIRVRTYRLYQQLSKFTLVYIFLFTPFERTCMVRRGEREPPLRLDSVSFI